MIINPNPAGQMLGYVKHSKGGGLVCGMKFATPTPRIEDALKSPLLDVVI